MIDIKNSCLLEKRSHTILNPPSSMVSIKNPCPLEKDPIPFLNPPSSTVSVKISYMFYSLSGSLSSACTTKLFKEETNLKLKMSIF